MQNLETNLRDLFEMLSKGLFIEAMLKYHHDDVTLREGNAPPKQGKEHCIALEKEVLATVAEFTRYEVLGYAIGGDTTYYEAIIEYKETSGNHVKVEQAVVSQWRDDNIISERFYHA